MYKKYKMNKLTSLVHITSDLILARSLNSFIK